ncbi:hypothetical protein [Aporhodopirellula aestuarii]|uniref:SPW repeat-containing protein n=1 Tax=Aporhodopirellula aestuarii TaxID=2950107 RepID=A0ABT0U5W4_9BACT|nr:hypothetical protein [Aporhodopirellula aestuarii]MCM2372328.1 hypothetical protein [Aporhodopirellula aestuarii]
MNAANPYEPPDPNCDPSSPDEDVSATTGNPQTRRGVVFVGTAVWMVATCWLTNKLELPDYQVFLALGVSLALSMLVTGPFLPTEDAGKSKYAALGVLTVSVVAAAAQYIGGNDWREAAFMVMLCVSLAGSLIQSKRRSNRSEQS